MEDAYRLEKQLPFGENFITLYTFNLGDIKDTTFAVKLFSSKNWSYNFVDMNISRRFFSNLKLAAKMSFSTGNIAPTDPLYINDFNTYLGMQIGWFF